MPKGILRLNFFVDWAANKAWHSLSNGSRGRLITALDVSTPKAFGAGKPLYAISRSNWSPESAEVSRFLEAASKGDSGVSRGTELQLINSSSQEQTETKPNQKRKIRNAYQLKT
jgi:hypothetical protein